MGTSDTIENKKKLNFNVHTNVAQIYYTQNIYNIYQIVMHKRMQYNKNVCICYQSYERITTTTVHKCTLIYIRWICSPPQYCILYVWYRLDVNISYIQTYSYININIYQGNFDLTFIWNRFCSAKLSILLIII